MGDLMRWRCVGCGGLLLGRAIDNPLMLKHRRPASSGRVLNLCREDGLMQLVENEAETHRKISARLSIFAQNDSRYWQPQALGKATLGFRRQWDSHRRGEGRQ